MKSWTWRSADPTRRATLAGLAAAVATALSGCVSGSAGVPLAVSSLTIDVGALKAKGLGSYADMTAEMLRLASREAFAVGTGGPRVVLVVTGLQWGTEPDADDTGGGVTSDYAEGFVDIVGPGGSRRVPMLVSRPSDRVMVWTPDGERARVFGIMRVFAGWARAEVANFGRAG